MMTVTVNVIQPEYIQNVPLRTLMMIMMITANITNGMSMTTTGNAIQQEYMPTAVRRIRIMVRLTVRREIPHTRIIR